MDTCKFNHEACENYYIRSSTMAIASVNNMIFNTKYAENINWCGDVSENYI